MEQNKLPEQEKQNLRLIELVKAYSVDSLSFKSTANFTKIYNQNGLPVLWVVTASEPYAIRPYYWNFPMVGEVSYKGFFEKEQAIAEKNRLIVLGYDAEIRSASAWSTLGWFSDPVLSNMLVLNKGNLCDLIFHELFHATYYGKGSVDFNENLASFVAHKATIQFLKNDTVSLNEYLSSSSDQQTIDDYIHKVCNQLQVFYDSIASFGSRQKLVLKLKKMNAIAVSVSSLQVKNKGKMKKLSKKILESKNAWLVDFKQYNSLQDSLEIIFNKNYNSDVRKLVQSLK